MTIIWNHEKDRGTALREALIPSPSPTADEIERRAQAANTFVIGLTGPSRAGCTTAAQVLAQATPPFAKVELSEILNEGNAGLATRDHMTTLSGDFPPRLVIDDIGKVDDVRCLQRALGDRFCLFAITADPAERYERRRDRTQTIEEFYEFDRLDQGEDGDHGKQVNRCIDHADVLIPNPHLEQRQIGRELGRKVKKLAALVEGRTSRPPTPDETFMNIAYGAASGSRCLKRQVGAVIVLGEEPLASGYNENPKGLRPCIEEFGACYRDIVRGQQYARLATAGARCPYCGEAIQHKLPPPWRCPACARKLDDVFFPDRAMKWCTALHAEERAIIDARGRDLSGATIYTTTFPCMLCTEKIIHADIRDVVYVEAYPEVHAVALFKRAKVKTRPFEGVRSRDFHRVITTTLPVAEDPQS
jgi:deoxycytidylate deaminase